MDDLAHMVRDTAERLLSAHCDRTVIAESARGRWPERLWAAVENAGLPNAAVSEAAGGAGLRIEEALDLVRSAGEHAAPIPLGETIIAAWLLDRAGLPVPDGPLTFAPAAATKRLEARRDGGLLRIAATVERVPWGRNAAGLVLAVEAAPESCDLVVVGPESWSVVPGQNLAREPRDTLTIEAAVPADRVAPAPKGLDDLHALGAALRTLQIAGALTRVGERCVIYAQDRVQFGRPLAKFQAIQQSLAVLAGEIAAAGAAADIAKAAVGAGALFPGVGVAKARAGEAAGTGAAIAHQVHGAIGFTLEHDLQLSTKRLWSWRDEFGNEESWNAAFGRHLLRAGPDRIWSEITRG